MFKSLWFPKKSHQLNYSSSIKKKQSLDVCFGKPVPENNPLHFYYTYIFLEIIILKHFEIPTNMLTFIPL